MNWSKIRPGRQKGRVFFSPKKSFEKEVMFLLKRSHQRPIKRNYENHAKQEMQHCYDHDDFAWQYDLFEEPGDINISYQVMAGRNSPYVDEECPQNIDSEWLASSILLLARDSSSESDFISESISASIERQIAQALQEAMDNEM